MKLLVLTITTALLGTLLMSSPLNAAEGGHYGAGAANIRDFAVPPEGFYYEQYNVFYHSDQFNDRHGNAVDSINVGGIDIEVEVDLEVFTMVPVFIWSTDYKILGANYAAYVAPTLGNTSVSASLSIHNIGLESDESTFGFGDVFVQPVWLGWHFEQADISLGYGFYAPVGKFDAGDDDNIGLGFWTNQFQLSGYYYLGAQKSTALMLATTYEIHSNKQDVDISPGNHVSLDWGISQYLSERFEVGVTGYSQWQAEDDSGSDTTLDPTARTEVHAVGGQVSYWAMKEKLNIAVRYLHEYAAQTRFQGDLGTFTLTYLF